MRHPEEAVSIVVGASGYGVGPAVAERLANENHRLLLVGRSAHRLVTLQERLEDQGAKVLARAADATNPKKVRRIVDDAVIHFGRVDNVVYTPSYGQFGGLLATTPKDLDAHLNISVRGPFTWMQAVVPAMHRERGGRFVFISNIIGRTGRSGSAAFGAGKAGMHILAESLTEEYGAEGIAALTVVIDGMLDHPGMRAQHPDKMDWSDTIPVADVAEAVHDLLEQDDRAMSPELVLRARKT